MTNDTKSRLNRRLILTLGTVKEMSKATPTKPSRLTPANADATEVRLAAYLDILDHPGHLVRRLHQISVSIFLRHSQEFDLTNIQYASLAVIELFPGIDQRGLGRAVALDRQTVSNVVRRLDEKGLIQRKQKNKRTDSLFLTGASRALLQIMRTRMSVVDDIILMPLTGKERDTFMALLRKLVTSNNALSRAPYEGS
jgi:DNA-binding MarR family transcriptional regulator